MLSTAAVLSFITGIKESLETNGFVLISGPEMKALLKFHGATEEDMAVLESGQIHRFLPIDQVPAMNYRQVSVKLDETSSRVYQEFYISASFVVTDILRTRRTRPSPLRTPTLSSRSPATRSPRKGSREPAFLSRGEIVSRD